MFRDVVKRYGKFTALDGLSFEVPRGCVFGLLGPNGAGKTTAIKALLGLEGIASGDIRLLGERAPSRSLLSRIGYMPQETALYTDITIRENLELFGALHGLRRRDVEPRMDAFLELVGLSAWRDASIQSLSGGMKHRASLVAALIHEPELLVLDEPTVGVDPELRASFWKYFHELRSRGVTVLITTHYMDEARNCDAIGLMRRGRLIAHGGVSEVLTRAGAPDLEAAFLKLAGRDSETIDAEVVS